MGRSLGTLGKSSSVRCGFIALACCTLLIVSVWLLWLLRASPESLPRPTHETSTSQWSTLSSHDVMTTFTKQWSTLSSHDVMTTFTKLSRSSETNVTETPLNVSSTRTGYGVTQAPLAVDKTSASMDSLAWTSLQDTGNFSAEYDTNFFSAYYDRRIDVPAGKGTVRGHPAVVVFGYHMKSLKDLHLYCLYTYPTSSTESTVCFREEAKQVRSCSSANDEPGNRATSLSYVCGLKCESVDCTDKEIPLFVALSSSPDCVGTSGNIPVRNRQLPQISEKKKFGVCLQSPVYGQTMDLQQIVEFIEMNRVLGAEIITMYVMEMKEDALQFLLHHYSKHGLLQLVKWRKLKKWDPLHYHGQILTMHDCLYRNMDRVKYLAVVDLDEVLLPLKHRSWLELVESIGGQDNHRYHSYRFGNCFYVSGSNAHYASMPCKQVTLPKYFQRTNQVRCYCDDNHFSYRSKYIMQTEVIVDMEIHGICQATRGVEYKVPHSVAVNAHYRNTVPANECHDKKSKYEPSALKYQALVVKAMGHQFCS